MLPPIVFVHKSLDRWSDIVACDPGDEPRLQAIGDRLREGRDIWVITAFLMLRRMGCAVELRDHFVPDRICVAHYDDIALSDLPFRSYVVAVRADRDRTFICDAEIVQSPAVVEGRREHYIPHWPQPDLLPRSEDRGTTVRTVGYFGPARNLAARFRTERFRSHLRDIGVKLMLREKSFEWHDYRDIDVVLAVRDGTPYFLAGKPVSKLVNAWMAGTPALVGAEPVFTYHRRSALDFIHVATPDDVIAAIHMLKNDPKHFRAMVENGRARARKFSHEALARQWLKLLYGPATSGYARRVTRPVLWRHVAGMLRYVIRQARRSLRGRRYERGYDFEGRPV